jgi:hypothetical protein
MEELKVPGVGIAVIVRSVAEVYEWERGGVPYVDIFNARHTRVGNP